MAIDIAKERTQRQTQIMPNLFYLMDAIHIYQTFFDLAINSM